jgi:hypothetical protein
VFLNPVTVFRMRKDVQIVVANCRHDVSRNLPRVDSGPDERGVICRVGGRLGRFPVTFCAIVATDWAAQ